jgi:KUP system potassium uptake protein
MRVDNDGEGGILALMALLGVKKQRRPTIVAVGLFGAALIYGDGAITPAISVLSALEGLEMAAPALQPYVVPAAAAILFLRDPVAGNSEDRSFVRPGDAGLVRHHGRAGARRHRQTSECADCTQSAVWLSFLFCSGTTGFLVLGAVFLCVTGAEALYADMGHFGARPIKAAWFAIVFPSLMLNYAGQAALVLEGAPTDGNIFYRQRARTRGTLAAAGAPVVP